jgi:hypothetical protein
VTLRTGESRPARQLASYRGFACAVIGVSRSLSDAIAKERRQGHHSPRQRKFFSLVPVVPRNQGHKSPGSDLQDLSPAGLDVSEAPPGCFATKRFRSGSPGLQASELRRADAARVSLKLSADNNLERYGTPRFHVEHFRGTCGTFCGTTRTSPDMDSVALNP